MPFQPDTASIVIELKSSAHSSADVRFLVDAVDGIVSAAAWAAIWHGGDTAEEFAVARRHVQEQLQNPKTEGRFFPSWRESRDPEVFDSGPGAFDPTEPMDAAVRDGLNSYLRRSLWGHSPELYSRILGFASIRRLEHHSPLLLELAALVVGAAALAPALAWGIMRAVAAERRANAELQIRAVQVELLTEDLTQKRLQTSIIREIESGLRELGSENIPPEAIAAAAQISTTAVADLGSNPLIGKLTIGLSAKVA